MLYDPSWEKQVEGDATLRVLHRAAELIRERGLQTHGFGGFRHDQRPICVLRAIEIAAQENGCLFGGWTEARAALLDHLQVDSVVNWTDESSRTATEAIDALYGAAAKRMAFLSEGNRS